jgi:hypothetical protein
MGTARIARRGLLGAAFLVAAVLTLWVLLLVGLPYGSTAVCVAYDESLLWFHRVLSAAVALVTIAAWAICITVMRRTASWRRVAVVLLLPKCIAGSLAVAALLTQIAPGWLDVSDRSSPACV